MRSIIAIALITAAIVGCASHPERASPVTAQTTDASIVTYYDRNNDGVADLEFHDSGCCDRDWALVDADFNGRYEKRVQWSYALVTTAVDIPVSRNVVLTPGQPPLSGWAD